MQHRFNHRLNLNNQLHHPGLDVFETLKRTPCLNACLQHLLTVRPWHAILDSGCTTHYLQADAPVVNRRQAPTPQAVRLPDGGSMYSNTVADLPITALPELV